MDSTSPDFRQELGFLNYSGYRRGWAGVDHTFTEVGGIENLSATERAELERASRALAEEE